MLDPFEVYNSKYGKKKQEPGLAWEESLGGAGEPEDFYEGHTPESKMAFPAVIVVLIFVVLFGRLGWLQLAKGQYYRGLANGNEVRTQAILAPRGIVYDSQGHALVQNVPNSELVVTPLDLPQDYEPEVQRLSVMLGFDPNDIISKIKQVPANSFQAISVMTNLAHDSALIFQTQSNEFPGFSIQNNPIRQYTDSNTFSHILGYTGKISADELSAHKDNDYLLNDYIGKYGLEYSYEQYLRGTAGEKQIEVDAHNNVKAILGNIDPAPGDNLVLNIDADLQNELYKDILAKNGNKKAAAVALNPETGQVLALVSVPGFDNNLFSQGISQKDYSALLNDPNHPLIDRAISGIYPPGSTIKPVIASAGLQEGVIDQTTTITDTGDLVVGSFHFRGWKPGGLGPMQVRSAIAMSSDIYFYTVGGGQTKLGIGGLGPERLAKYDSLFGMGQKLGIDLQGESTGIVGSPEERKAHTNDPNAQWYLGDTYHESIGQGDMAVTPLQVAEWTATVANGGTLYKPYIVNKVTDNNNKVVMQNKPTVIRSGFIDPKNIQIVREGMRQTVTSGTAKSLGSLPVSAAGKTGTAQFDGANPNAAHAWFTAFAPFDNPQIVITVLIEAGGEGSTAATPVVKDALQWWAKNRYNQSQ